MIETDVLIVGFGPAGAALALSIRREGGIEVACLDRGPPSPLPGQTLPGAAGALLRDLGVLAAFEEDAHSPLLGQVSVWGSDEAVRRDSIADPHGAGWRLDRPRFDRMLRQAAVTAGCRVITGGTIAGVRRDRRGGWVLRLAGPAGSEEIGCRVLVDASGRRAVVARSLGMGRLRHDRLVCQAMRVRRAGAGGDLDSVSIVEAAPGGWHYGANLGDGEILLAFHTDADLAPVGQRDPAAHLAAVAGTTLLRNLAGGTPSPGPVIRRAAWSGRLARVAGQDWAAVGDAALCLDPLSSQGLFHALYGGLRLGGAIRRRLRADAADALPAYATEIDRVWTAYRRHATLYYGAEPRWPEAEFWRRRKPAV